MRTGLNEPLLRRLYSDLGKTDSEIASFFQADRTTIVHLRKQYGIESRKSVGEIGEEMVIKELRSRGFRVEDMNLKDKLHPFDLLLEGYCRVEVKSSRVDKKGFFNFSLTDKPENKNKESDIRIRLSNGRTKKLLEKTCDLLVLAGLEGDGDCHFFLMKPDDLKRDLSAIRVPFNPFSNTKYSKYRENWKLLEDIKKPDVGASDLNN